MVEGVVTFRNSILETYPDIKDYIDNFLPKKDQFKVCAYIVISRVFTVHAFFVNQCVQVVKCHDHIELLVNSGGDLIFFR